MHEELPIDGPDGPTLVRFSHAASVDAVPGHAGMIRASPCPRLMAVVALLDSSENFCKGAAPPAGAFSIVSHHPAGNTFAAALASGATCALRFDCFPRFAG